MRRLIPLWIAVLAMLLVSMSCIVDTRPRRARSCPPSYHWNGDRCVHNSYRGRGPVKHKKHKHKKHRKHH